ncbi:MerR family transcriptional regulator [Paenibacillus sp. JCM 10914]|uniref:MerR family transcriptional regulator n=1 Tax=Paenibacillus sp. JCM 10914 TaxID=1236974 RepID=UPI0003CC554C|nr:MerR family transcriptional regulator [Paenibacillus sp. JCM 10914]GAE07849.1 transcriptional regulator [Paenibacillus sp. JCM 10914]
MLINELSHITGVSLRSLRYYEEKQLLQPTRSENGYRNYEETDIERVRIIQMYFNLGLSVSEILSFMECAFDRNIKVDCLPNAIELGTRKLAETRQQITMLQEAESHLEQSIKNWKAILDQGVEQK